MLRDELAQLETETFEIADPEVGETMLGSTSCTSCSCCSTCSTSSTSTSSCCGCSSCSCSSFF